MKKILRNSAAIGGIAIAIATGGAATAQAAPESIQDACGQIRYDNTPWWTTAGDTEVRGYFHAGRAIIVRDAPIINGRRSIIYNSTWLAFVPAESVRIINPDC